MAWYLVFAVFVGLVTARSTYISATDDSLVYTGRVLSPEFGSVLFDWSGIEISLSFSVQESVELVAIFTGAPHFYNVFVDGTFPTKG